MRWQRIAQTVIAILVVGFIGLVITSMRRQAAVTPPPAKTSPQAPKGAVIYNPGACKFDHFEGTPPRKVVEITCGKHTAYGDGRVNLADGVRVVTHRNDKELIVNSREADFKQKGAEFDLENVTFKQDVWLRTESGLDVKADEATYAKSDGMLKIPGPVVFRKGRMSGSGVGATYDQNREVLWILAKAHIEVAAGKDGKGALEGDADTAGMARADHYMRLTGKAEVTGEGRRMNADEIVITLTEDDERVQMTQLRGNSRISGGTGGPQSMTAQDIDLMYAEDGRTLQNANLMQRASVQLAGAGRKRIAGNVINIALAPDGTTVTNLSATENVQLDLPAEPKVPAKRIRAATLQAIGAPDAGLRNATFTGKVEYRETQAAARNVPAIDRTARSDSLVIDTKPGLGALEKADFRGNVTFVDAPDITGEGPQAIYAIDKSRIEILSTDSYPGPAPRVSDGKISVTARTVAFTLGTRELAADTKVKSTVLARQDRGRGQQASRTPSMLKQGEPINITANRLQYLGATGRATYSGNVSMWQDLPDGDGAHLKGDTLIVDDKTGNLEVKGNAVTAFTLEDTDKTTGQKKKSKTTGKADHFEYDDAKRIALYTGNAQFDSPQQGNLTAPRIQVTMKTATNEVERLEAWAQGKIVTVKESLRTVTGIHLTYTAANDTYVMVGTPVIVIEEQNGSCQKGTGSSLTFVRGTEFGNWTLAGLGTARGNVTAVPCTGVKR